MANSVRRVGRRGGSERGYVTDARRYSWADFGGSEERCVSGDRREMGGELVTLRVGFGAADPRHGRAQGRWRMKSESGDRPTV